MSHATYDRLWADAQRTLDEATAIDSDLHAAKPQKDKRKASAVVCDLYVRYVTALASLDQCYDQIVQPQKRLLVRKLLDASLGRMLELKHELVNLDLSEFSYYDDVLISMNILPQEAEITIPQYYRREREQEIRQRRKTIDDVLKRLGFYEDEGAEPEMTEDEATRLIQVHERARQGRLRAQFMREIRHMKDKAKPDPLADDKAGSRAAALRIQKIWRGFITRRKIRRRVIEEMLLIGMLPPVAVESEARRRSEEVREARRAVQAEHQRQYEQALVREKEHVRRTRGEIIKEEIADAARCWYMDYKANTGKFPDFPSEESGGSAVLFSRQGAESEMSKSTAPSSKDSKGKKDKAKKAQKEKDPAKKRPEDEEDPGFKMLPSSFLGELVASCGTYQDVWCEKDERGNPSQTFYRDMILQDKEREVEAELRKTVDHMLRQELERLQAALDRDRARKGKRGKKASKKKGRRGGKKGKKKKERDLTPDRTLESLFEELVANGIIRKYPEVPLAAFKGERSFGNLALRQQGKDPLPSLGDVRQAVLEYCVLPLGSPAIHAMSPLVRSVLLAGPAGSGKRTLVHAVCTETGSVLFDLSAANIVGKYPGKAGLVMLVHLVSKVSRLLQPSVIFMDCAEKPFLKKVPKTDKTDPKRLKKDLPKLVKSIGPEDQVLLMGISRCPWECDQKALAQVYTKMILIPRPDYASRSYIWSELLFSYSGVNRQFDTAAIAQISDGYTVGRILAVLRDVMTCKRILQMRVQPLTHAELVTALSRHDPVYKEEEEAFLAWFQRTPIGRRKARAMELEELQRQGLEPQPAK
ncbi:dynein regulatory complex protein 11 [Thrips palmi]|uniref:Dynein regulatory complex protein 11 n=1 Tax=Thrips palmi TaxID=161013 RepID=A0A6P8ZY68_THRPL|nr:dynein regulatory complex protein 11 [Thrips palmi]